MTLKASHLERLCPWFLCSERQLLPHPNPGFWVSKSVLERGPFDKSEVHQSPCKGLGGGVGYSEACRIQVGF